MQEPLPRWLRHWRGDGVIARIDNRRIARALQRFDVPVIDVSGGVAGLKHPIVGPSPRATMSLLVNHFLDVGIREFGFYGEPTGEHTYFDERRKIFAQLVEARGFSCRHGDRPKEYRKNWNAGFADLIAWLRGLPKPVGIVGCHDDAAQEVIEACRHAGIDVPVEAAVAGCSNDEYLCHLSQPTMTSVDLDPRAVGYAAARLLDRLMRGGARPSMPLNVGPRRIVVRESTDMIYGVDGLAAESLRFIREHASSGINVADVARQFDVSRRSLERQFHRQIGRTPKQEILRIQLETARHLLEETSLGIKGVASRCGFRSTRNFLAAFKKAFKTTPTRLRAPQ
jgi:LacI family transcriptional regulator